jgi:hypothetical protein
VPVDFDITEYMIGYNNMILDFMLHYIVFLTIGVFLALLLNTNRGISMSVAFLGALVVTILNHTYFPNYRFSILEPTYHNQNRLREAIQ